MAISFSRQLFTPERASEILERNNNKNRSERKQWVGRLAGEIRGGSFVETHQPIAFFPDGEVMDGQHRLAAIVAAGLPTWLWVAQYDSYQEAKAAWMAIDRGAKRNLGDMEELAGELPDNGKDRIAVAHVIRMIEFGEARGTPGCDTVVARLAVRYKHDYDAICGHLRPHSFSTPQRAAFIWSRCVNSDAVDALAEKIAAGIGLDQTEAVLRDVVMMRTGGGSEVRISLATKTIRGIEACLAGERLSKMQHQTRENVVARLREAMNKSAV
jgi:hypothetical protein